MKSRLKIGLSACFSRADPARSVFTGKALQFVAQSIAHWLMAAGAMVVMVPRPTGSTQRGDITLDHQAQRLDGWGMHGAILEDFAHAVRQFKSPQGMRT